MAVGSFEGPSPSYFGIGRLFSLFYCLSLSRLLILLMSGKVHSNLAPCFPVQCALKMWPGGIGRCNAALAPNGFI